MRDKGGDQLKWKQQMDVMNVSCVRTNYKRHTLKGCTANHTCAHTRGRTHVAPAGKTKRQEPPLPLLLVFVPKAQTLTPE